MSQVAAAGDALLAPSVTRLLIEAFAGLPAATLPSPSGWPRNVSAMRRADERGD